MVILRPLGPMGLVLYFPSSTSRMGGLYLNRSRLASRAATEPVFTAEPVARPNEMDGPCCDLNGSDVGRPVDDAPVLV